MSGGKPRSTGLRTQILLILVFGAVLPLALVGVWLTSSTQRSGASLLQSQLEESVVQFAAAIQRRWTRRMEDIQFIAGNEPALRAVTQPLLDAQDRDYLDAQLGSLHETIPHIELRDQAGALRWETSPSIREGRSGGRSGQATAPTSLTPTVRYEQPILDVQTDRKVGVAVVAIAVTALVPDDSARPLIPGSRVGLRAMETRAVLVPMDPVARFPDRQRATVGGVEWMVTHQSLNEPPVEIAIGAPLAPYVDGSGRAASIGVAALLAVAIAAIVITVAMATRATRPLSELVSAADAITNGQLERHVGVAGPTEVRQLGVAFNVMTDNLRATLDSLSRRSALAAVGEFATSLSHDVRNALTSVKVDLERAAIRDIADPVASGLVKRALANVVRLENAVTTALQVARSGQVHAVTFDMRSAIEAAAETARGSFALAQGTLDVDLPTEAVCVSGDPIALRQLFANLLFNAAQALEPRQRARITAVVRDAMVEITITDAGRGMTPAELERVENTSYSSRPEGTGLGLPIARRIVLAHRGELVMESVAGKGTTVRVRIPHVNEVFTEIAQGAPPAVLSAAGTDSAKP